MNGGRPRVEVITRPGTNAWRHEVNAGLRDQALDARQAFAPERGEGQTRRLSWSLSGPLVRERTSMAARLSTRDAFDAQTIVATRPSGPLNDIVNTERGRLDGELRLEHALSRTHTLRVEYQNRRATGENLGVGDFDLRERAYGDERQRHVVRLSESGTFGTKLFNEFRLEFVDDRQTTESLSQAVTVNVQNAFMAGGAQRMGGHRAARSRLPTTSSSRRTIGTASGWASRASSARGAAIGGPTASGTFTFASLADYETGRPRQFVQRTGDPLVSFSRSRVQLVGSRRDEAVGSPACRRGAAARLPGHVDERWNLAPRLSVAWTPAAEGRTTVNAGFGVFNSWFADSVYEQTLRLDGMRQRDLIIRDPSYPIRSTASATR
jgi:hypothetical protein